MPDKKSEAYVYYLVRKNLQRIRKDKKMTQEKLASKSSYSYGYIMNIESRRVHQTFSLGLLWSLATALEVDIREFFKPIEDEN